MVICPRCQQPVDETARTTCPLCYTPIDAATASTAANTLNPPEAPAAPSYGQSGMAPGSAPYPAASSSGVTPLNGSMPQPVAIPMSSSTPMNVPSSAPTLAANQRMTLSGEVIEAPPSMAQQPAGNSQYKAKPGYGAVRREEAPAKANSAPIITAVVVVLLIGLGGFGGWYFWMHRTNPKEQATKYLTALKLLDVKGMYETTEVDPEKYKSEQDFVEQTDAAMNKMPQLKTLFTSMFANVNFTAGEPKYTSMTEATVPVTVSGAMAALLPGQTNSTDANQTMQLKMKNFNGIWKVSKDNVGGSGLAGGKLMGGGGLTGGGLSGFGTH